MPDCTKQQQRVDDLKDELADLKDQMHDATGPQKAGIGQRQLVVRQRLTKAEADLRECLTERGSVFPQYYIASLLHSPPGIGSEVEYASGTSTGTTTDITKSFKTGLAITASTKLVGNGADLSVEIGGGVKSGTGFEVKTSFSKTLKMESRVDKLDHAKKDTFLIWTNVRMDMEKRPAAPMKVSLALLGDGKTADIVSLTVGELRDPSTIPAVKMKKLPGFTDGDFKNILSMNPLATNSSLDPARYRPLGIGSLQLDGPDHETDSSVAYGYSLTDEHASSVTSGTSRELKVGLKIDTGWEFIAKATLTFENTWTWEYETTQNISAGETQEASVSLKTDTVGYHNVIDVYQDMMFKTFVFVARHDRLTREQALIAGLLTDSTLTPLPHRKVLVTLPSGEIRTVFSNAQGMYRVFDVPDGEHAVTVGDVTSKVQVERGKVANLPLRLVAKP